MDVITIGDGLINFNPTVTGPMRFVGAFERKIGGAELNFALGCARLGLKSGWISRLGQDEFGRHLLNTVRGENVDVSEVQLMEGYSTSLNFKELMEDGSSRTFYYRQGSPTLTMKPDELNENYFKNAKLLHISGVFPAIDPNNVEMIKKALELAKKHGLTVSFDPNIRLKLWSKEQARETLLSFLPYVDIVLTGDEEGEILFGVKDTQALIEHFKGYGVQTIIIKRGDKGSVGYCDNQLVEAAPYKPRKVVDTVGAGDGFDAGFIYGYLNGWSLDRSLQFANAVGAMVVSVKGDNEGLPYLEDVQAFLGEREIIER